MRSFFSFLDLHSDESYIIMYNLIMILGRYCIHKTKFSRKVHLLNTFKGKDVTIYLAHKKIRNTKSEFFKNS